MKRIKLHGFNLLSPTSIGVLVIASVVVAALAVNSFRSSTGMSAMNNVGSSGQMTASPAMKLAFAKLSSAHTDVCQDMGNKQAIDMYMNNLPDDARLQGSCCSPMDMKKYVSQMSGLKAYADIPQIPSDPYDISKLSAQQMLGYYDNIQLTPAQQSVYDAAQKMTADHGWCCCQCWAWYTHAGLAKYLITQHNYTAQQVVTVINLEDCCGGN